MPEQSTANDHSIFTFHLQQTIDVSSCSDQLWHLLKGCDGDQYSIHGTVSLTFYGQLSGQRLWCWQQSTKYKCWVQIQSKSEVFSSIISHECLNQPLCTKVARKWQQLPLTLEFCSRIALIKIESSCFQAKLILLKSSVKTMFNILRKELRLASKGEFQKASRISKFHES